MFISSSALAELPVAPEYVSIDCPKGDITLFLDKNGSFILELKYWDNQALRHTHSEKISGEWSYKNNELALKSEGNLIYKRDKSVLTIGKKSASIDSFYWVSSTSKTFADSFALIERIEIDNLFKSVTPKQ